ncbi:MAG: hypothetical protein AAFR35_16745 [Pseudomonadota bacterium]
MTETAKDTKVLAQDEIDAIVTRLMADPARWDEVRALLDRGQGARDLASVTSIRPKPAVSTEAIDSDPDEYWDNVPV